MAKKTPPRRAGAKKSAASVLASRVEKLERDVLDMRSKMGELGEDLSALRTTVKHVDERTLRGETLMLDMQGAQRRMEKTIERIAVALHVETPKPEADADETPDDRPNKTR